MPAIASTYSSVSVAMPERRCRKFRATRSAERIDASGPFDLRQLGAGFDALGVGDQRIEGDLGVQRAHRRRRDGHAGDDAELLRHEDAAPPLLRRDERPRRDVVERAVLLERREDQRLDDALRQRGR